MKSKGLRYKYNKNRLYQACAEGDRDAFDFYSDLPQYGSINVVKCVRYSLRKGHVELAEYILSEYILPQKHDMIFSWKYFEKARSATLIEVIQFIEDKKKTPNLYKLRDEILMTTINHLWRHRKPSELITCLNKLPLDLKNEKIKDFMEMTSNSDNTTMMKDSLRGFLRDDIIDEILK
jgi:hypothetical protein